MFASFDRKAVALIAGQGGTNPPPGLIRPDHLSMFLRRYRPQSARRRPFRVQKLRRGSMTPFHDTTPVCLQPLVEPHRHTISLPPAPWDGVASAPHHRGRPHADPPPDIQPPRCPRPQLHPLSFPPHGDERRSPEEATDGQVVTDRDARRGHRRITADDGRQVGRWVPDHGDRHVRSCHGTPYDDPSTGAEAGDPGMGEGIAPLVKPTA